MSNLDNIWDCLKKMDFYYRNYSTEKAKALRIFRSLPDEEKERFKQKYVEKETLEFYRCDNVLDENNKLVHISQMKGFDKYKYFEEIKPIAESKFNSLFRRGEVTIEQSISELNKSTEYKLQKNGAVA